MDTLKNYTFLQWLRLGIAADIPVTDDLGADTVGLPSERAETEVRFKINGQPISQKIQILGPGDQGVYG